MKYLILIALLSACSGIEKSTGKVLDNGNSIMNSEGTDVWWGAPEEKTQSNEEETFEDKQKRKSKVY